MAITLEKMKNRAKPLFLIEDQILLQEIVSFISSGNSPSATEVFVVAKIGNLSYNYVNTIKESAMYLARIRRDYVEVFEEFVTRSFQSRFAESVQRKI